MVSGCLLGRDHGTNATLIHAMEGFKGFVNVKMSPGETSFIFCSELLNVSMFL